MTHPVLGSLTIGYAPIVDAQRSLAGLRLTLVPQRPDAPVDGAALKEALVAAWPQAASDSADSIRLKLQPTPTGGVAGAKGFALAGWEGAKSATEFMRASSRSMMRNLPVFLIASASASEMLPDR